MCLISQAQVITACQLGDGCGSFGGKSSQSASASSLRAFVRPPFRRDILFCSPFTSASLPHSRECIWNLAFFLGISTIWNFLQFSQDQLSSLPTLMTPGLSLPLSFESILTPSTPLSSLCPSCSHLSYDWCWGSLRLPGDQSSQS